MSFEFEEKIEEPKDYTKRVWIGIFVLFALAILCMVLFTTKRVPNSSVVTIRHILVKCPLDNPEEISRAKALITELRQRLNNGEAFAKLAAEYSDDPGSARSGGMLAPSSRGTLAKEIEKYAWDAPPGEISPVIATEFGFHIVVVVDRFVSKADLYEEDLEKRAREVLRSKDVITAEEGVSSEGAK